MTRAHVLSNGEYSVLVTARGGGVSTLRGLALTRWQPDPARDAFGVFLYLRDTETGEYWSIGEAPAPGRAAGKLETFEDRVELDARYDGIDAHCVISVGKHANIETRRIRIHNRSDRRRSIEVTTFTEISLNTLHADAAHPAFSKLFIETAFDAEHDALIAWRRQRSPDDRTIFAAQRMTANGAVQFDTDRARFIGRRRSPANPVALCSNDELGATVGAVLDPAFIQRVRLELEPGSESHIELTMCAADAREQVAALLRMNGDERARCNRADGVALPASWGDAIRFDLAQEQWRGSEEVRKCIATTRTDYGDFSADGTEYIIPVSDEIEPTPQPWINVVANEGFGFLVSETGAGYTWAANSRENRITPWSNDAVSDPHGEMLLIHDLETAEPWSLLPGPLPAEAQYEARHGFGYSCFTHSSHGLAQNVTQFVPRSDPVKLSLVELRNTTSRPRRLRVISYAQLVLGGGAPETRGRVTTHYDDRLHAVLATNPERAEFSDRVAFATALADTMIDDRSASGSRSAFLAQPHLLNGVFGSSQDPCAAQSLDITIPANQTAHVAFLLGEADEEAAARACIARYQSVAEVSQALAEVTAFWRDLLTRVQVETPSTSINLMLNGWLAYQNLACRMWARSAFYQSGGAFGFRDQLQDSSALLYLDPAITRDQILLHAAHQFVEGDVLHWWHPPLSKGIRTRFSDDLLWLPYITLFYIDHTGDRDILNERVRYLTAALLEDGEDEVFVHPHDSGESGSLYEHCCGALDRSLTAGAHGLPLIGVGDWNDGMNRVGREGRGESVWLGFFLFDILDDFIALCQAHEDTERVHRYREYLHQLAHALNEAGWDGEWYRRAYYDNGAVLGSVNSDECRIDALAQAWAVLSRAAPADRAQRAIASMRAQLVSEAEGIIRLLTPAFDRTPNDPGYIKGYIPGVRENGGQYTHAAVWAVRAIAEMGDREIVARLLEMLTPVGQFARNPVGYGGEPYVIAADVYGEPPHVGRAGWTWYTGSAGWLYRVLFESLLGFSLHNNDVVRLRPCIPRDWPGFSVRYRFTSGTTYVFDVTPVDGSSSSSQGSVEDGGIKIPIVHDGGTHHISVNAGDDVVPRYEPRVDSSAAPLLRTTSL